MTKLRARRDERPSTLEEFGDQVAVGDGGVDDLEPRHTARRRGEQLEQNVVADLTQLLAQVQLVAAADPRMRIVRAADQSK